MRKFFLLIIFCCVWVHLFAQQKNHKTTYSIFWAIKNPKNNQVSFLLGSMHVLRADSFLYRFKNVLELLQNSRIYACESLGFTDSTEAQKFIKAFNQLPKKSVTEWFGKDSALVDDFFVQKFSFKEKPSFVLNNESTMAQVGDIQALGTIVMDSILTKAGLEKHSSPIFDEAITKAVKDIGKPILQLDNADLLTKLILINNNFASNLVEYIKNFQEIERGNFFKFKNDRSHLINNVKSYYKNGTLTFGKDDNINKAHIQRNKMWLKKLTPELKKGNVFIVVGFWHLIYNYGLINQLRKQGFILTPVNLTPEN